MFYKIRNTHTTNMKSKGNPYRARGSQKIFNFFFINIIVLALKRLKKCHFFFF